MGIMKRPDHTITSWVCNRPFPNLSTTLMIYFVKAVDRFGQNPLNFTFTKYASFSCKALFLKMSAET